MDHNRKPEIRRQTLRDRSPRMTVIVAAQHADVRARSAGSGPLRPAAMILHVQPPRCGVVARDLVHALTELRVRIWVEARADAGIGGVERFAAVFAQVMPAGRNAEMLALTVADDRVHAQPACAGLPFTRVLMIADARHHLP